MSSVPGPRTNPTVKSLANSNQKTLQSWHITLGPIQSVALIGIITGCMTCAFYLGFYSGQKIGIETALNNNLSSAMRLPIESATAENPPLEDGMSDVYAKLNDESASAHETVQQARRAHGAGGDQKKPQMPELGSIQTTDAAPVTDAIEDGGSALSADSDTSKAASNEVTDSNQKVRVLGESPAFGFGTAPSQPESAPAKTLGSLVQDTMTASKEKPAAEEREKEVSRQQVQEAAPAVKESAKEEAQPAVVVHKENRAIAVQNEKVKAATQSEVANARRAVQDSKNTESPAKSSLIKSSLPHGWFAQIIAPKSQQEAEVTARKLKTAGFPVVIENAIVRGDNYYRVLVGPEDSRAQAERLIAQLKREPYLKAEPFLRMVK